jgi:ferredoxin
MKLTSEMIKQKAKELGIDDIGIGNAERFKDAPALLNVLNYFPDCKSVIAVVMRIPRGSYRGIEEGTHWHNYTFYSYNRLNTLFRPQLSNKLACFIEDHGWEAVLHYPAVAERQQHNPPVEPGRCPPDISASVRILAAGCGVGEIGYSKVFLNKKFGPRLRIGIILTDAVLDPDPILDTGTICMHCGACVRECPGNAVPPLKDKNARIYIKFPEKTVWYGDVQMGRCTLTHHGMNNRISPFLKKEFPNMAFDVEGSDMTEEEAYRLSYTVAQGSWGSKFSNNWGNSDLVEYYRYVLRHTGYYAVCGARGCIRACMDSLEKARRIENTFKNPFYNKQSWLLSNKPDKVVKGINPWREKYLDEKYPGIRTNEYNGYVSPAEAASAADNNSVKND